MRNVLTPLVCPLCLLAPCRRPLPRSKPLSRLRYRVGAGWLATSLAFWEAGLRLVAGAVVRQCTRFSAPSTPSTFRQLLDCSSLATDLLGSPRTARRDPKVYPKTRRSSTQALRHPGRRHRLPRLLPTPIALSSPAGFGPACRWTATLHRLLRVAFWTDTHPI